MAFCIINFMNKEGDSISIVPENWLRDNKRWALWPASKEKKKIMKAIEDKVAPDASYQKHRCHVMTSGCK